MVDREDRYQKREGGWSTFPFIIGFMGFLALANGGWLTNLLIYLIKEFNIKTINATLIANVVNGCVNVFPVVGAVIADSLLGSFSVVLISSCISLLGMITLTLTATIDSLRPQSCDSNDSNNICESPSKLQYSILYLAIILTSVGMGCIRFTTATLGANQFKNSEHQNVFFNWFFFTVNAPFVVSSIGIVYIEDNVSWGLGFGICIAANFIGIVIFLLGNRFYRHDKPQGSPFTALARVLVATIRKRLAELPLTTGNNYYYGHQQQVTKMEDTMPTESFRCLNHAALITEGDVNLDGSIAKPWRLCRVQEVEDFKALLRLSPLWLAGIFLSTPIVFQISLSLLQVLTMDRHLTPNFEIPPASFSVTIFISLAISLAIIDRFLYPLWQKLVGKPPTPLERVGLGHIFNVLSLFVAALVESKRLKIAHHLQHQPEATVPMLSSWLLPQLVLVGIGEAFHFPGEVALFYQEFPMPLRSTAIATVSMAIAVAIYLTTALIDLIRRITKWLPNDINEGRLDNVYWIMFTLGVLNFCYFLVCAKWYKYQNVENGEKGEYSTIEN